MDKDDYRTLRFDRRRPAVPRRLIPIGVALAVFTLIWVSIPESALYLLLLPLIALVAWVASYGWRQALTALHDLLHRLNNL